MTRQKLRLLGVLLATALAVFGVVGPARAASGNLGGITGNEYCQSLGYDYSGQVNGQWECFYANGQWWVPMNLDSACKWQFQDLTYRGYNVGYAGSGNCWAYNTTAYYSPGDLSALPAYCQSLGYQGLVLEYHTVTGWRCYSGSSHYKFDMHAACRWVYSSLVRQGWDLVSYFNSYSDSFGIVCLAMKH